MADLWLARATGIEGFERHVAVKRIRHEQARDARFVQMFLDEARLAASLHHNNIATVHDIGQEGGEYFFTMEYVHGEDLRKILMHIGAREQSLPIEHVMTIVLATAAALHYAHEHKSQVVHRDVSPANIIIGYDGNVKVVDFGIAKAAHRTRDTQSGVMKGKVAYMSPEQCVGQQVDRRSDIFSLGIVMYELFTVRRLFKAANDFLTMSSIIHGAIPPISSIRPGIPAELEGIIMRALNPERDDRFQTAEEMRTAIERFCATHNIRTSSTGLADYMRSLFGHKPEPWLVDDEPELELTYDFDGTLPGVVKVPEAALKRYAVPATTPVQPNAPIMKARTKAITGAPPLSDEAPPPPQNIAAALAVDESTEIVAPLPLHLIEEEQAAAVLRVGDNTMMIRPPTTTPKVGRQIAVVVVVAVAVIGIAFGVMQLRNRSVETVADDKGSSSDMVANPNIRLPPPSNPVVTPDAAEIAVDAEAQVAIDAAEAVTPDAAEVTPDAEIVETSPPPKPNGSGSQSIKKKKKPHRPKDPKDPAEPWDPNTLFPKK
jgi:serine/threonine protein kinase